MATKTKRPSRRTAKKPTSRTKAATISGTAKKPTSRTKAATISGMAKKRNLFTELTEGLTALREEREGKRTLRTHEIDRLEPVEVSPAELRKVREDLNVSRPVFAAYLRTNPRTLENWEQGRAQPNSQAALLIRLVKDYPDTVERLAAL